MNIGELSEPVQIGQGAFGKVYRVREAQSGQYLAMKVIDFAHRKVWERETRALQIADHEIFPRLLESGEEDEGLYLLMEFVWGDSLDAVIDRRHGFAQPEAMRMAISLADGLAWLAQKDSGFVFRDLKAENLILTPEGTLRLIDLGCMCHLGDDMRAEVGTKGSSAPEQFKEDAQVGLYSDVYAFGKLLCYMMTGIRPQQQEGTLLDMDPSLSACLALLIDDCVREESSERIPDMIGVLSRLMDIAGAGAWQYRKMEKAARKKLLSRLQGADVVYEKSVRQ